MKIKQVLLAVSAGVIFAMLMLACGSKQKQIVSIVSVGMLNGDQDEIAYHENLNYTYQDGKLTEVWSADSTTHIDYAYHGDTIVKRICKDANFSVDDPEMLNYILKDGLVRNVVSAVPYRAIKDEIVRKSEDGKQLIGTGEYHFDTIRFDFNDTVIYDAEGHITMYIHRDYAVKKINGPDTTEFDTTIYEWANGDLVGIVYMKDTLTHNSRTIKEDSDSVIYVADVYGPLHLKLEPSDISYKAMPLAQPFINTRDIEMFDELLFSQGYFGTLPLHLPQQYIVVYETMKRQDIAKIMGQRSTEEGSKQYVKYIWTYNHPDLHLDTITYNYTLKSNRAVAVEATHSNKNEGGFSCHQQTIAWE